MRRRLIVLAAAIGLSLGLLVLGIEAARGIVVKQPPGHSVAANSCYQAADKC
jgi:hypothetical protein